MLKIESQQAHAEITRLVHQEQQEYSDISIPKGSNDLFLGNPDWQKLPSMLIVLQPLASVFLFALESNIACIHTFKVREFLQNMEIRMSRCSQHVCHIECPLQSYKIIMIS
jgi:hypothetical protein